MSLSCWIYIDNAVSEHQHSSKKMAQQIKYFLNYLTSKSNISIKWTGWTVDDYRIVGTRNVKDIVWLIKSPSHIYIEYHWCSTNPEAAVCAMCESAVCEKIVLIFYFLLTQAHKHTHTQTNRPEKNNKHTPYANEHK